MATKPTLADARWATDLTNNTAPSSGQRDTGWTPNQVAVSDYFNVLANEAYKWFQWLDGNPDIDVNDLHVLGDLDVDGSAVVGVDLDVGGSATVGGSLEINTSLILTSSRTMTIGAAEMQPRNDGGLGATMDSSYNWVHNVSGASFIYCPVRLPINARIVTASWFGYKGSATGTIAVSLRRTAKNGSGDTLVASIGSNGTNNPGNISINSAAINHTIAGGFVYYVLISTSGQSGDGTFAVDLVYDGTAV